MCVIMIHVQYIPSKYAAALQVSPYKLRTALLGFVLIPVILVIGVGGTYSLHNLEQQVEARMQEDIELIARAIRLPLSHALEWDLAGNVQQALDSAFDIDRVYGVYVYGEDGRQIAGSGTAKAQVQTEQAAKLAAEGNQRGEFGQAGGERIFSYFVPLTDTGGRINGLLQVTRRGTDFSDYLTRVRNQAIVALTGIGLLLVIVVLVGHYGAVGRHLRNIEKSMVQIGFGAIDHRVPIEGPSEIRVLGRGINDMLGRIAKSRTEIDQRQVREIELRSRLQQSEKLAAIGQLASGIAHELGTPLSTVDGKAQQLLRRPVTDQRLRRILNQIRTETARMERIIRQLLDFGRNNPLTLSATDCAVLIRTALDKVVQEPGVRNIAVQIKAVSEPVIIMVDQVRLEQAVTNLLRNAVQACKQQIRVSWSATLDQAVITIEDDGPGIEEAHLPYLFDPFYTTKATGEGTGLGLSVAHAAIADHGGFIEAGRSTDLHGACFRIVLSREREQEPV